MWCSLAGKLLNLPSLLIQFKAALCLLKNTSESLEVVWVPLVSHRLSKVNRLKLQYLCAKFQWLRFELVPFCHSVTSQS